MPFRKCVEGGSKGSALSTRLTLMPTQHMRMYCSLSLCTVPQRDMVEGEDGFVAKPNSCLIRFSGMPAFTAYLDGKPGGAAGALLVRVLPTVVVAALASFFMARFM